MLFNVFILEHNWDEAPDTLSPNLLDIKSLQNVFQSTL